MPAVKRCWTAAEVRQLIADNPLYTPRYELVDGELLVTSSPGATHQAAVQYLWLALAEYLARHPVGTAFVSPLEVELEREVLVQPDVLVVPPHEAIRIRREMPVRELLLAAEVLSPSSGRHDRVTKRPQYQRHMSQYWIVDLDARIVERWTPADERPEVLAIGLHWHPEGAQEPLTLDLLAYFARVLGEA